MNILSQVALYYEIDKVKVYGRHHSAHLIQTAVLLKRHGCRKEVIKAGLLHSIYDTNSIYHNSGVPLTDREKIVGMSGKNEEELVYHYSRVHIIEDYREVIAPSSNDGKPNFPIELISDLSDILVCDVIEQIIWCVDKKNIFTYQDSYKHIDKLAPVVSYCRDSVKEHYKHYLYKSIS
ncbi:conserved hypothetical protein [Xenorhabdus bovienii str. oregonense]|uniref:DUF6817 domain-containing protein n=1 Tax=Xenorhabdus bovienii str. oregonense TaxID=1398202 RepID=A0A077P4L8_XENBV|nr:hypothetical protein [Xenorhabdus bovienii]CDH05538.1 conserved hypothetical protein [Xenorhabdus bovienii str. oregonense]